MQIKSKIRALGVSQIQALLSLGAEILDIRDPVPFGKCHARDSINIQSRHVKFKERVEMMFSPETSFILMGDDEAQVCAAIHALLETMEERILGYVRGGISAWTDAGMPVARVNQMSLEALKGRLDNGRNGLQVLDVREPFEWALSGHIEGAILIPMGEAEDRCDEIPRDCDLAVVCAHGVRSSTVASILQKCGFDRCLNVTEGMEGWRQAGYPRAKYQGVSQVKQKV